MWHPGLKQGPLAVWNNLEMYWVGATAILIACLGVAIVCILTFEDNKKQKIISFVITFIVFTIGLFGVYANKKAYESGVVHGYIFEKTWYSPELHRTGEILSEYGYLNYSEMRTEWADYMKRKRAADAEIINAEDN